MSCFMLAAKRRWRLAQLVSGLDTEVDSNAEIRGIDAGDISGFAVGIFALEVDVNLSFDGGIVSVADRGCAGGLVISGSSGGVQSGDSGSVLELIRHSGGSGSLVDNRSINVGSRANDYENTKRVVYFVCRTGHSDGDIVDVEVLVGFVSAKGQNITGRLDVELVKKDVGFFVVVFRVRGSAGDVDKSFAESRVRPFQAKVFVRIRGLIGLGFIGVGAGVVRPCGSRAASGAGRNKTGAGDCSSGGIRPSSLSGIGNQNAVFGNGFESISEVR